MKAGQGICGSPCCCPAHAARQPSPGGQRQRAARRGAGGVRNAAAQARPRLPLSLCVRPVLQLPHRAVLGQGCGSIVWLWGGRRRASAPGPRASPLMWTHGLCRRASSHSRGAQARGAGRGARRCCGAEGRAAALALPGRAGAACAGARAACCGISLRRRWRAGRPGVLARSPAASLCQEPS